MKSGLAHHVRDVEVGSSNLLTPTLFAEVPQQWGDDELSFLGYFLPVSFFERASLGQAPTSVIKLYGFPDGRECRRSEERSHI